MFDVFTHAVEETTNCQEEEATQQAEAYRLENERLVAELAALKKQEEACELAEVERIRQEEEVNKVKEAIDGAQYVRVFPDTGLVYVGHPDLIHVYTATATPSLAPFEDVTCISLVGVKKNGYFTMAEVDAIIEKHDEFVREDEEYDYLETVNVACDIHHTDGWENYLKSMG
jgi:hypothetical protein